MKTLSVLLTVALLLGVNQLAIRLKQSRTLSAIWTARSSEQQQVASAHTRLPLNPSSKLYSYEASKED